MNEIEKARILIALLKAIDDATSNDDFPVIDFQWQDDTTEKMALAALKALEKEIKTEATK